MSTPGAARDPRPSRWARAAGLAFLPLPLVPFLAGLGTLLRDPTRPGSGCFEYCAADRDGGRIALVLGVIGIWIAVLIWRRHVAAMALALFVSALLTGIWFIGFVMPILTGGSDRYSWSSSRLGSSPSSWTACSWRPCARR
jgi:hypothetical protein